MEAVERWDGKGITESWNLWDWLTLRHYWLLKCVVWVPSLLERNSFVSMFVSSLWNRGSSRVSCCVMFLMWAWVASWGGTVFFYRLWERLNVSFLTLKFTCSIWNALEPYWVCDVCNLLTLHVVVRTVKYSIWRCGITLLDYEGQVKWHFPGIFFFASLLLVLCSLRKASAGEHCGVSKWDTRRLSP